jgi:hypothetical protein
MQDSPDRGLRHWATYVYRALYTRGAPVRSKAAAALAN